MDVKYLIHRGLALILTLVISYVPIILNTKPFNFENLMENGEIIFSLIALLAVCMFEVLENNFKNITITLGSFVLGFCVIIIGMTVYIYQTQTPESSYWKTNLACLITSVIMYFLYYGSIALKKKEDI